METAKLCNVVARDYLRYALSAALRGEPVLRADELAAVVKHPQGADPQ